MSTRWRLAVLAGLFALVSACGAGGEDPGDGVASVSTPKSSGTNENQPVDKEDDLDKMRKFAKCMREHGIDMKDPEMNADGGIALGTPARAGGDGDHTKMDKANEACKKLLPNGGEPPKMSAKDIDNMRKTAKCLREHGIDVPDPTAEKPFLDIGSKADADKMEKAMKECGGDGGGAVSVHVGDGDDK